MYTDKSFYDLANILISINSGMSISNLANMINKTRGMVYYNIDKINIYLSKNNVDKIINDRKKGIILTNLQKEVVKNILKDMEYILNKNERRLLIVILITTYPKKITVEKFSEIFKTSKNSILSDISYIKDEIKKFDSKLNLEYIPIKGYILKGQELVQIQYIYKILKKISRLKNQKFNNFIFNIYKDVNFTFTNEFKESLLEKIIYMQARLGKTFSSNALKDLTFSFPYIYIFIKKMENKSIEKDLSGLKQRLEYKVITEISSVFEYEYDVKIDDKTKLVITLILLCTRKINDLHNFSKDYENITKLSKRIINEYIIETNYKIEKYEEMVNDLVTYIKVWQFREKYNIIHTDSNCELLFSIHKDIYEVLLKIIKKENLNFNDSDFFNLVILFDLHTKKEKINLLVVSSENEVIKKSIVNKIEGVFSNVNIIDVIDEKNIDKYMDKKIDLVLTTELGINLPFDVFFIEEFLNKKELVKIFEIINK